MIERMMNMKNEFNIEELEKQCAEAERNFKELQDRLTLAQKEIEENKKAKLAAEKQARYDEIVAVYKHFEQLRSAYVDDYGYFTFESNNENGGTFDWVWKSLGLFE
jgi:biopolymer transport protein ExbD